MNLLSPIAPATIAMTAGTIGVILVLLYILKMRRRRFEVPFSTLWQRVLKEKEATSLWRHLKRILSLLLLLTIVGLLLFATLDPVLGGANKSARSVIIIVDASASMKSVDEGSESKTSRLDAARDKVISLLDTMGSDDAVMLMRMDGRATPLSRFQSDVPKLKRTVQAIEASDTPADLRSALSASADALRWRQNPQIIIVGDGAYPEEALASVVWQTPAAADPSEAEKAGFSDKRLAITDLSGIDVRYVPVGQAVDNVGIIAFNVRRYISNKLNYEVYIEIQNFSDKPARRRLVLFSGDSEIDVKEIDIAPGEKLTNIYADQGGGDSSVLRAKIEAFTEADEDAFALDDEAWALIPENKRQKVLLVSEDNLFMEGALLVFDHLDTDKLSPAEYEAAMAKGSLGAYDAAIFHSYTPKPADLLPSPTHLMYFNPQGEHSPFKVTGSLPGGRVTFVSETHPVMRWIEMDDVNFDALATFEVDQSQAQVPLATSIRSHVAAAKKDGQRKIVALGFSLDGTDLMMRVAFPLLMVNALDWFAGADSDLITTYTTGRRAKVPLDGTYGISEVQVHTPSGKTTRAPVSDGYATFFASEVGIHRLTAMSGQEVVAEIQLASNLSSATESDIEASAELILGGQELLRPIAGSSGYRQSLWLYLALMVLLLLIVEWYTFNRRITV